MASVLVTGGMGVIGSWVTRELFERGVRVVTYQRSYQPLLLKDIVEKIDCVSGDVLDLPRLIATIGKYQVERVVHMAGLSTPPLEANPFLYRVNVDGAVNVFEACRLTGVKRAVYISTKGVYGAFSGEHGHPTYRPVDEDHPKRPVRVYPQTRLFGEHMGLSYHRIYGLDFVALRFASTFGPGKQTRRAVGGETGTSSHAFHSKVIESAMLGSPLKIPQGADQVDDMVYHRDIASGIVLACFAEKLEHRAFNIGTGCRYTLGQFVATVKQLFPGAPIEIGPGPGAAGTHYCVLDIGRARRELGYSPKYDIEAGAQDYVATMRKLDIAPVVV